MEPLSEKTKETNKVRNPESEERDREREKEKDSYPDALLDLVR